MKELNGTGLNSAYRLLQEFLQFAAIFLAAKPVGKKNAECRKLLKPFVPLSP